MSKLGVADRHSVRVCGQRACAGGRRPARPDDAIAPDGPGPAAGMPADKD